MNKKDTLLYIAIPVAIIIVVAAIVVVNKKSLPENTMNTNNGQPERQLEPLKKAENGDLVVVNYTGTLENGTKFDSSYDRNQPFGFILGQGMVIKGWDEEMVGLERGDKKHLVIKGDKAYGEQEIKGQDGKVLIPKNSTLIFDIEIVEVVAKEKVDAMIKQRQEMEAAALKASSTGQGR
ncbi:MAG: FKBP-type peptidyl-prolyl cis-trans isomerase [Patescibacteria group bacterium]